MDIEMILEAAQDNPQRLTSWEIDFLENVSDIDVEELTERQVDVLIRIAAKLGV